MSSEIIVSKKFRILIDAVNKVYNRVSFWSKASDVEFTSGSNAQTTLGSITGISSSLTSTSSTVAASAYAVKQLNDKITALNSNLGSKKYIIKDGVIQSGYSILIPKSGISWQNVSSLKALSCESSVKSTSNHTCVLGSFLLDLTNIKYIYMTASAHNYNYKPTMIIATSSSKSTTSSTVTAGILDVSNYSGNYYLNICTVFGTCDKFSYSNYVAINPTTGSNTGGNPWFLIHDLYFEY